MAEQFDQPQVGYSPPQPVAVPDLSSTFTQLGAQYSQLGFNQMSKANASFDQAIATYNKYAEAEAQNDAYGSIKRDGNGQIIPPSTYFPSGFHSVAYINSYRQAAESIYRQSAVEDYSNHSAEMRARYPNDPVAYSAAMTQKRNSMMQGLAEDQKPYIDLRFQQIQAQGASQIAVSLQADNNAQAADQYGRQYTSITNDTARLATQPSVIPNGQPGTIKSVIDTLSPGVQSRITSADRSVVRNAEVGGAKDSAHLKPGSAIDIGTAGMSEEEKRKLYIHLMSQPGITGIGFYGDHIHVDTAHATRTTWGDAPPELKNNVQTWTQGGGSGGLALSGNFADDVAKARAFLASDDPNASMLRQRLSDLGATGNTGGIGPAKQRQNVEDLAVNAVIAANETRLKGTRLTLDDDGQINQAQIVQQREQIRAYAATYPEKKEQIEQRLNQALDYGISISNNLAQSKQLAASRVTDDGIRQRMKAAEFARSIPDAGLRAIAEQRLKEQALRDLDNRDLTDAQAIRLSGASTAAAGVARSAFDESITNRLQGLTATMFDPTSSPDAKVQARNDLHQIYNDPTIRKELSAGQAAYAQSSLDKAVIQDRQQEFGVVAMQAGRAEGFSPSVGNDWVTRGIQSGAIGPNGVPLAQALGIYNLGVANFNKDQAGKKNAAQAELNQRDGTPNTAQQIEDVKAKTAFTLPKENPVQYPYPFSLDPLARPPIEPDKVDFNDPVHRSAVIEYSRRTGVFPDRAKASWDAAKWSPNEAEMAGKKAAFQDVWDWQSELMRKRNGGQEPNADLVKTEVASIIGEKAANAMALYSRYEAKDVYAAIQKNASPSITGQTGAPDQVTAQGLDRASDKFAGQVQQGNDSQYWTNKLVDGRNPLGKSWNQTDNERATTALLGGSPQAGGSRWTVPGIGNVNPFATRYDNVTMAGDLKKQINEAAGVYLAGNGKMLTDQLGNEGANDQAVRQVITNMANQGLIEMVPTDDGKNAVIQYTSLSTRLGRDLGLSQPLNQEATQKFVDQLVQAERRQYGMTGAPYDPTTIVIKPVIDLKGQAFYQLSARDPRSGTYTNLLPSGMIAQNDPRISAETLATQRAVANSLMGNWVGVGPEGFNKKPDAGSLMATSAAIVNLVLSPFEAWQRQSATSGILKGDGSENDTRLMQQEFDRRIRDAQLSLQGNAVQPDWQKTMANIVRDPETHDGRFTGPMKALINGWLKSHTTDTGQTRKP